MFHTVEKYRGPAKILLGLIALTFVGFGVSSVAAPGSDYIAKVGEQKISEQSLNAAMQNDNGGQSRESVFQSLLQRAYLIEGAKQLGISVSQEQLKQLIVNDPSFHDESGKFSQQLFNQYLSRRHQSEDQFVSDIREQFALQNLLNLIENGAIVSDVQAKQLVEWAQSVRTIRSVSYDPRAFAGKVKADDAALKKYYEENKAAYTQPLAVKLQFVELNAAKLAEKQTVSPEELKEALQKEQAQAVPKREVSHILFPVVQGADDAAWTTAKQEAEAVLAKLNAQPQQFAALARQYSKDEMSAQNGGSLGIVAKDGGLGSAFEEAAFALKEGQISDLVKTEYGYHIIKAGKINVASQQKELEARVEAEIKQRKAQQAFNEAKEKLADEAFNSPDSLTAAAQSVGATVEAPDEWLSRAAGEAAGMPKALLDTIFSDDVIKKKHNSEPVAVNDGVVWVVRAKEVRPETLEPFEKVKDVVRADYIRSEAVKLAEAKAKQDLVDLKTGEKIAAAWSPVETLAAEKAREVMSPEAYNSLMKVKPKDGKPAYVLLENMPVPVLVEVQKITPPAEIEAQVPQAKATLVTNSVNQVYSAFLNYLQNTVKQKQGIQKVDNAE